VAGRTAAELDAFTGVRRGELIGRQCTDVDFENLVIHVRRSVVMMVQGTPKTEVSAKDVPLDAPLAASLIKLRLTSPYNRETDWVFASPTMKGKQPLWPALYGDDMDNLRSRQRRSRNELHFTPSGTRIQPY
jgi:integrase